MGSSGRGLRRGTEGTGLGGAATAGAQQRHSLTRRLRLLPHLEELALCPWHSQGRCWQGGSRLGAQACPPHLAGVSLCAAVVCMGDPCTPNPPRAWPHMDTTQVLPPSLANTRSHQCWNTVPRALCCPLRVCPGLWQAGMWGGQQGGTGGHRSGLCPSEQGAGHRHLNPPSASPRATPRSHRAWIWAGGLGSLLCPLGVPSSGFAEWFQRGEQVPRDAMPGTGKEPSPSTDRSCSGSVSLPLLSPQQGPLAVSPPWARLSHAG